MARTDLLYDVKAGDLMLTPTYPDSSEILDLTYDGIAISGVPSSVFTSGAVVYAKLPFVESNNNLMFYTNTGSSRGANMEGDSSTQLKMSHLPFISLDIFSIRYNSSNGRVIVGDGKQYDMNIGAAKSQNASLLLLCDKGDSYRYPNIGVGIRKYLHGNQDGNELAREIINEFSNDSVSVLNASFDKDTGELELETKEL